jgi:hypothetical protein
MIPHTTRGSSYAKQPSEGLLAMHHPFADGGSTSDSLKGGIVVGVGICQKTAAQ